MSEQIFKPSHDLIFDTVNSDSLRLNKMLKDNNTTSICLDLSDVRVCDSAGLALLIEAQRLSRKYDKILTIKQISKQIIALAKFCGVENMLTNDVK